MKTKSIKKLRNNTKKYEKLKLISCSIKMIKALDLRIEHLADLIGIDFGYSCWLAVDV